MELQFKHLDTINHQNIHIAKLKRDLATADKQLQQAQTIINQAGTAVFDICGDLAQLTKENAELLSLVEALTKENEHLRGIDALVDEEQRQ